MKLKTQDALSSSSLLMATHAGALPPRAAYEGDESRVPNT